MPFEEKGYHAKYVEANKILEQYSAEAVFRAATLGAHRKGFLHAEYVYRKLQDDPDTEGWNFRKAEKYYLKNPSML